MKYSIKSKISRDTILSKIREEDIFHRYLGIYPEEGLRCCNPLRDDEHPDCVFYINPQGRMKFRDIPMGWNWDCFNVVEYKYSLSFSEALQKVGSDFGLLDSKDDHTETEKITIEKKKPREIKIETKRRNWNLIDKNYWTSHLISSKSLDFFNVFPISHLWINGELRYTYKDSDPAYAYHFGPYQYKIYFPLRSKKQVRFIQNVKQILQGYEQLPDIGDHLIITKSYKDVIFLYEFGITSIAPLGETTWLTEEQFSDLYNRFDNIFTLMDFDYAGIKAANRYRKMYELQPLLLTNGRFKSYDYGAKDISEFGKKYGLQETLDLIEETKELIL